MCKARSPCIILSVHRLGPIGGERASPLRTSMHEYVSYSIPLLPCKHFYWIKVFDTFTYTVLDYIHSSPLSCHSPTPPFSWSPPMSFLFCAGSHSCWVATITTALLHLEGITHCCPPPHPSAPTDFHPLLQCSVGL